MPRREPATADACMPNAVLLTNTRSPSLRDSERIYNLTTTTQQLETSIDTLAKSHQFNCSIAHQTAVSIHYNEDHQSFLCRTPR